MKFTLRRYTLNGCFIGSKRIYLCPIMLAMKNYLRSLGLLVFLLGSSLSFSQFDLAVTPAGLTSPVSGCYLSTAEQVTIVVVNNQATPYSGTFNISYSVNMGAPVTETVTTFMPGSGTYIYSFVTDADMSACMVHSLAIWVYDINDINNANDSISVNITSDCAPVVGTIGGPDTLCSGINSDSLTLWGYTGNILDWESSTDGIAWASLGNVTDKEYIVNQVTETYYWTIVGSPYGYCPSDTTAIDTVWVYQQSDAGVLPADFDICDNGNSGVIFTTGFVGNITDWLESSDNGASWSSMGSVNDSIWFSGLTDTTMYQVIAVNGNCPADTSAAITLTLIPGSYAGTISGSTIACNFNNGDTLFASGFNGTVTGWAVSTDSGATWLPTAVVDSFYVYSGLQVNTMFAIEVTQGTCPPDYATHFITVYPINITVSATPNPIVEGDTTQLDAYATGAVSFTWSPDLFISSTSGATPMAWPDVTTTYDVQIVDATGCVDTAQITITVLPDITDLIVPNLITPNGDTYNDQWIIQNIDSYPLNEVYIFNGYGQKIYEASPYNNDWDGSFNGNPVPDGTYFYLIRLNEPTAIQQDIQGVITIIGNE